MNTEQPDKPSTGGKDAGTSIVKRTSIFESRWWAMLMLPISLLLMLGTVVHLVVSYRSWVSRAGVDISIRANAIRFSVPVNSEPVLQDLSGEKIALSGLNYVQCSNKAEEAIRINDNKYVLHADRWMLLSAKYVPDTPPKRSDRRWDDQDLTIAQDGVKSIQVLTNRQDNALVLTLTRVDKAPPPSLQRNGGGRGPEDERFGHCLSSTHLQVSTKNIEIGSLLFRTQVVSQIPVEKIVFTEMDQWEKSTIDAGTVALVPASDLFYEFEGSEGDPRKLRKGDLLTVTKASGCEPEESDKCSLKLSVSVDENPDLLKVLLQGHVRHLGLKRGSEEREDLLPGRLRWVVDSYRIEWAIVSCGAFLLGVRVKLVEWWDRIVRASSVPRLIGTFAVLSILAAECVRAQAPLPEEIRRAVVLVSAGTEEEGSGIVLDARESSSIWLITAAHVVMLEGRWRNNLSVRFHGDPFTACPAIARAFGQAENEDVALLEVPRCKDARLPRFPVLTVRGNPHEGEVVWAIGHVGDNGFKATAPAAVSGEQLMRTGQVTVRADGRAAALFRFDSQNIVSGFSGGPVLNERGELLGMTVERDKDSGSATALKIETILDVLRSQFRFPEWSQLKVESGRPTDLEEVKNQLEMLQKRTEVVFSFFDRRKQEIAKAGGHLRPEIESALVSASENLRSAATALAAGQTTAVRRYMESAQTSLKVLDSFR